MVQVKRSEKKTPAVKKKSNVKKGEGVKKKQSMTGAKPSEKNKPVMKKNTKVKNKVTATEQPKQQPQNDVVSVPNVNTSDDKAKQKKPVKVKQEKSGDGKQGGAIQSKLLKQQVEELRVLLASKITNEMLLVKVFEKLDQNHDGTWSSQEFNVLVHSVTGQKADPAFIQAVWERVQSMGKNDPAVSSGCISMDALRSFLKNSK